MPFDLATYNDLWRLVDELRKPFRRRDQKWTDRRRIRYRRMEHQLRSLPLNPAIADHALMVYQSEVPNQEIHKRVKRLVANRTGFEWIVFDDDPETQRLGQDGENGIKALYKWQNRGKVSVDWKVTQHQQGDGLGILKESFIPGHGDMLGDYDIDQLGLPDEDGGDDESDDDRTGREGRNAARSKFRTALGKRDLNEEGREAKAYDKVTDDALRKELPPFRLESVDPLVCYWWEDEDGIEVIAETGKKAINPLLESLKGYGLQLTEDKQRFVVTPGGSGALSAHTSPASSTAPSVATVHDLGQMVTYIEIRTRYEIAILIEHPRIKGKGRGAKGSDRGVILTFDNPFGPYTTGYALVPADVTTEEAEEDKYQPPSLAAIDGAQIVNVLTTARISAALENALAPKYVKVASDAVPASITGEDKTPDVKEGTEVPSIPGEVKRVEVPNIDLDKADARIVADMEKSGFQEVLAGEAASEATGHRLAIQVGQADLQLVPYQNARADAIKELMMGVLYAIRSHGLTVYIPTIPDGPRKGKALRVAETAFLSPEMADMNFELSVSLGAETPVTKYAKWQALSMREQEGTLSWQSLIEESDVENPEDEIKRIVEGKAFKGVIDQVVPLLTQTIFQVIQQRMFPPPPPSPEEQLTEALGGVPPETGRAGGGGRSNPLSPANVVRSPGVNMPVTQTTSEDGPNVPEPAELGRR